MFRVPFGINLVSRALTGRTVQSNIRKALKNCANDPYIRRKKYSIEYDAGYREWILYENFPDGSGSKILYSNASKSKVVAKKKELSK